MSTSVSLSDTLSHSFHPSILRAYDIRGIFGETLFADDATALGKAFASTVIRTTKKKSPVIALAYDGRLSTPALRDALIAGLTGTGATVHDFGLGPTPMLYFAVHHTQADAGIMITGSHNPGSHNGFKMMLGTGSFFGKDILALGELAARGDFKTGSGELHQQSVIEDYLKVLAGGFQPDGSRHLKVVFDPGNGATGNITHRLAALLPGEHTVINGNIDGNFPNHHPDPTVPANMQQLTEAVQKEKADFGIAFDGDGDRIGAVDKTGRVLYGDQLMILFSRDVLQRHPGATIIADVKASQTLFDDIAAHGGKPLMWKTGHSLVKTRMKETGAKLAGEMSGHIFFADEYFGYDDGIYSAVRLINLVAHGDQTLEAMIDALPQTYNTPEIRIDVSDETKFALVEDIKHHLTKTGAEFNDVDGVRVNTEDGWWLARASNTQPAIIVRAEGPSAEALARLKIRLKKQLATVGVTSAALD